MTETVELSGQLLTKGQMVAICWSQLVMELQFLADTTVGVWLTWRIHVKGRDASCSPTHHASHFVLPGSSCGC